MKSTAKDKEVSAVKQPELTLWYRHPAPAVDDFVPFMIERRGWERYSLPLGNGRFGATVFGRLETERVQITDPTLANPPYVTPRDPKDRKGCCTSGLNNFAELLFDVNHSTASDYRRSLSLDTATVEVSYLYEGVRYRRTAFLSNPDGVLVIRFSSDTPGTVSLGIHPELPFVGRDLEEEGDGYGKTGRIDSVGDTVTLSGEMLCFGTQYEGVLRVLPEGGTMTTSKYGRIWVDGADSVTVLFACSTNYRLEPQVFSEEGREKLRGFPHPHEAVAQTVRDAAELGFDRLYERHLADYRALFGRVSLSLDTAILPDAPTDELLRKYREGCESRYLEILLFQYGRYLLIASSRDRLPANLQGIWNPYAIAPWSVGYWHNINIQMNYWLSGPANLRELFLPYLAYARAYMPRARANADAFVEQSFADRLAPKGENGWIIGTGCGAYAIAGFGKVGHSGPGTGAFTSLLFWDFYEYTQDIGFLRDFAYPALYGMATFFTRILEEIDGKMLVRDSASPEMRHNGEHYHTTGCAFDQQMIYENDRRTLEAAQILGIPDDDLLCEIRRRLPLLDPVLIGESGQVKEYREETTYGSIGDPHHRHISHLVGLYPATVINRTTPEWMAGARITLDGRGDKSTGWAAAHRLLLRSRIGDAEGAMRMIRSMFANNIMDNLWDTHPPFQIDGNFGFTAGVCEMLLQSHAGFIDPLPALPAEWRSGSFDGLVARGAFLVSAEWKDGALTSMRTVSEAGGLLRIRLPKTLRAESDKGKWDENGIFEIMTAPGERLDFVSHTATDV